MQAYKFVCGGVYAIMMAEDDEAVMKKAFGHLEETRSGQAADGLFAPGEPKLVANGGLWRLGEEDDEPLTFIQVWTDGVKFVPPKGSMQ